VSLNGEPNTFGLTELEVEQHTRHEREERTNVEQTFFKISFQLDYSTNSCYMYRHHIIFTRAKDAGIGLPEDLSLNVQARGGRSLAASVRPCLVDGARALTPKHAALVPVLRVP